MKEINYFVRNDGDGYINDCRPKVEDLEEPIIHQIFAPDPITGNPASDIYMEFSSTNQNVRDYINAKLRQPLGVGSVDKDGDAALESCRRGDESRDEYISRLAELVQS